MTIISLNGKPGSDLRHMHVQAVKLLAFLTRGGGSGGIGVAPGSSIDSATLQLHFASNVVVPRKGLVTRPAKQVQ